MPRSGTTLLAQCLNAHSGIVVPDETDFIIPMSFIFDRIGDEKIGRQMISTLIVNSGKYKNSLGEYLDPDQINEVVSSCNYNPSSLLNTLYAKLAESAGATLAGDKSPNDISFLRMLVKTSDLTPDMKIIHIVRDIRDVMVSVNKTGWVSDLDLYFPRFWCSNNLYLNAIKKHDVENYLFIRYEDLVKNPEQEITRITRFLGLEFEEEMLLPEKRHGRYKGLEVHKHLYSSISDRSVGKYKKELDPVTLRNHETQAREALIAFGYASSRDFLGGVRLRSLISKLFGPR